MLGVGIGLIGVGRVMPCVPGSVLPALSALPLLPPNPTQILALPRASLPACPPACLPAYLQASFSLSILEDGPVDAFCGWFDTQFKGSPEHPVTTEVTLTTAPDPTGATHWGQQVGG